MAKTFLWLLGYFAVVEPVGAASGPLVDAGNDLKAQVDSVFGNWNSQDGLLTTKTAGCDINSFIAFFYLSQAGRFLQETAEDCNEDLAVASSKARVCAANVLGVIQSFWNAGAYLAGLASQCMEGHNQRAECAAVVMSFVGTLTEFFQSVTESLQSCGTLHIDGDGIHWVAPRTPIATTTTWMTTVGTSSTVADTTTPRPSPWGAIPGVGFLGETPLGNSSQGWCFINTAASIPSLAQAGWLVEEATQGCQIQDTDFQRRECAADALSIISALGNVANFIADAAIECGHTLQMPAQCVKDLGPHFQSLGTFTSDAFLLKDTCMRGKNLTAGAFAGERRLSEVPAAKASPGTGGLPGPQFV